MEVVLIDITQLSLWDVGFQSCGEDPDQYDSHNLPLKVKNAIRTLCAAVFIDQLPVHSFSLEDLHNHQITGENATLDCEVELDIVRVAQGEHYKSELLKNVFVDRDSYFMWLLHKERELPGFWDDTDFILRYASTSGSQPDNEIVTKYLDGPRAKDRLDRKLCRAIAQTLWLSEPKLTIKAVCEHEAIQRFGNGRLYPGRDTIRNWIKDLSPNNSNKEE